MLAGGSCPARLAGADPMDTGPVSRAVTVTVALWHVALGTLPALLAVTEAATVLPVVRAEHRTHTCGTRGKHETSLLVPYQPRAWDKLIVTSLFS